MCSQPAGGCRRKSAGILSAPQLSDEASKAASESTSSLPPSPPPQKSKSMPWNSSLVRNVDNEEGDSDEEAKE